MPQLIGSKLHVTYAELNALHSVSSRDYRFDAEATLDDQCSVLRALTEHDIKRIIPIGVPNGQQKSGPEKT